MPGAKRWRKEPKRGKINHPEGSEVDPYKDEWGRKITFSLVLAEQRN
jgi:hypothetical protein